MEHSEYGELFTIYPLPPNVFTTNPKNIAVFIPEMDEATFSAEDSTIDVGASVIIVHLRKEVLHSGIIASIEEWENFLVVVENMVNETNEDKKKDLSKHINNAVRLGKLFRKWHREECPPVKKNEFHSKSDLVEMGVKQCIETAKPRSIGK